MRYANIVTVIFTATQVISRQHFSSLIDVKSLSELPVEALLNIKKNVISVANNLESTHDSTIESLLSKGNSPQALPFYGEENIKKKSGYYVQYVDENSNKYGNKKSVSKIFQSSVTVLAFLAFGGYIIFLIIAAIKGKQYNHIINDPNTTQIMQAIINSEINKRKRRKTKPMLGHSQNGYRIEEYSDKLGNSSRVKRNLLNSQINVEVMYQALVNLCEAYNKIVD